jgi:GNAT superfamily N-acetyltransferase
VARPRLRLHPPLGFPAPTGLLVWGADEPAGIVSTVNLIREPKANGRHRAEIVKLMVHRGAHGHGLGRALLTTAERAAADAGATLLLLDTVTDTRANRLSCSFFYKPLQRRGGVTGE